VHYRKIVILALHWLNCLLCCKWLWVVAYKLKDEIFVSQLHDSLVLCEHVIIEGAEAKLFLIKLGKW